MQQTYVWIFAVLLLVGPVFTVGRLAPRTQWYIRLFAALALIGIVWLLGEGGRIAYKFVLTAIALGVIWEQYRAYRNSSRGETPLK